MLARKAPSVLKAGLRQSFKKLPDSAIARVPAADRPFLDDPLIRDVHLRTMRKFLGNTFGLGRVFPDVLRFAVGR